PALHAPAARDADRAPAGALIRTPRTRTDPVRRGTDRVRTPDFIDFRQSPDLRLAGPPEATTRVCAWRGGGAYTNVEELERLPSMPNSKFVKLVRYGIMVAALMGIWMLLSGRTETKYLLIGFIGSLAIATDTFPSKGGWPFPRIRFLSFFPWHLWQI